MLIGINILSINKTHKLCLNIILVLTFNVSGLRTHLRSVNESKINQCNV